MRWSPYLIEYAVLFENQFAHVVMLPFRYFTAQLREISE